MTQQIFDDEEQAIRFIQTRLGVALSSSLALELAEQFAVYCGGDGDLGPWPTEVTGPVNFDIGAPFLGPWTVREQDLGELKALAAAVIAVGVSPEGGVVCTLVLSAACMMWRLRRRGVSPSPLELDVLIALRSNGPMSTQSLADRLSSCQPGWTRADVESALESLRAVRLRDGTVVALVQQATDGLWSTDARGLWEIPFGACG